MFFSDLFLFYVIARLQPNCDDEDKFQALFTGIIKTLQLLLGFDIL